MATPRQTRSQAPRRRRGRGAAIALVLIVLVVGGVFAALGYAAGTEEGLAPRGTTVGGVSIGGLDYNAARAKLARELGRPAKQPVEVAVAGKTFTLTAKAGKFGVDYDGAVRRAISSGEEGSFVKRGWRKLAGSSTGTAQTVTASVDRRAVRRYVDRIATAVELPARDAQLDIKVTSIDVTDAKPGRALTKPDQLVKRVLRTVRSRNGDRTLRAETSPVEPSVTKQELLENTPTVLTVDKASTSVRVFEKGKLQTTYRVAIGDPDYPTPEGQFNVQTMQVDPPWNVPNSEWAGDKAGKTIPAGSPDNPLIARWIGFSGAIGFHGTNEAASIGSGASKGCVRMKPPDIIAMYKRVKIGTPVLVA